MSETSSAPEAVKPERGPRRESTRIAAAVKIATTTADPAKLRAFLSMKTDERKTALEGLAKEHEDAAARATALKTKLKEFTQFAEETSGFGVLSLVQVTSVLDARLKE